VRTRRRSKLLLALLLFATSSPLAAQNALVLSGGGARGLAHAGVIRVMEELGYDPDLVVGASMGSIIGALYAAGYTPEQIRERILDVRWQEVFAPTPVIIGPSREVRWPMMTVGLSPSRQRVQRGLFGVWRINRGLTRMLFDATARTRGDFDKLPRRFRAVAADLKTGSAVVLDSGDLARAVRASIAVPGIFAPLVWDERALTDGGIADNLPIGVARTLGAQHIVAVDVSKAPRDIPDLAPVSILQRVIDLMQESAQRNVPPPDVLVLPDIGAGLAGMSFPQDPEPLIELGVTAARRDLPRTPPRSTNASRTLPAPPRSFERLVIEAPDSALAALARHAFDGIARTAYSADAVLNAVDRLYTSGLVEAVWTTVVDDTPGDDTPTLVVRIEAQPAITVDGAAGFENDRGGRAWGTLTRYTSAGHFPLLFSLTASTDGLRRTLTASATNVLSGRAASSVSAGGYGSEYRARSFEDDIIRTQDVARAGGWLGLEFPRVLRDRLTTAVVNAEWVNVEDDRTGSSIGPMLRFSAINPETMPVGEPLLIELERRFGDFTYSRASARGSLLRDGMGLKFAIMADARAVSYAAPPDVWPALGNEHAVPGLRWGEDRAPARIVTGIDAAYPVRSAYIRLRTRAGAVEPPGIGDNVRDRVERTLDSEWTSGAQLALVWRTPLGVLDAGYGINNRGRGRFDFSIGGRF
jgi:predicted acylesterase/phospholipase RssA